MMQGCQENQNKSEDIFGIMIYDSEIDFSNLLHLKEGKHLVCRLILYKSKTILNGPQDGDITKGILLAFDSTFQFQPLEQWIDIENQVISAVYYERGSPHYFEYLTNEHIRGKIKIHEYIAGNSLKLYLKIDYQNEYISGQVDREVTFYSQN